MKTVLKIVASEFKNRSRDIRELSVVSEFDTNIIIMAKGDHNEISNSDGYIIHKKTTRPLKHLKGMVQLNRICSIFTWAYHARKIKPYCISGHDIIALFIGWVSTWFISPKKRPKLVYDSHEFEIGRNTGVKRSKLEKYLISRLERFLMNKCAFSIMVNDSIADEVQRIHKLKERPVVVRNIPNYWVVDNDVCQKRRQEFCDQLGVPKETFLVMYHGGIMSSRGIETLLISIQKNMNVAAVILGYGEEEYIQRLEQLTEELRISERVLFHEAVPLDILWQYVGAADVGVAIQNIVCLNHYYMLPNKLFENIQSLTPIIGSDTPEISRIIKGYDIGLCVDPESTEDIANAIEKMRTDKDMYSRFKNNLKRAKEELCWENEGKVLETAYEKILRS